MAEKIAFGLEEKLLGTIDWELAVSRILHDMRSDFIYAPHLRFIYAYAGQALIDEVVGELKAGTYTTGVPLHIEVPKSARMRTSGLNRLGPPFSRPGAILLPKDRLFYQAVSDQAAELIEDKTDQSRSFSHRLSNPPNEAMFVPTRQCWGAFQKRLRELSQKESNKYVLRTDIANCFGSLNQHTLINTLTDAGFDKSLATRLEIIITRYTGDRSSRGILQGIYPSDLLGNFYLNPIDRFLDDIGFDSARYVDDIYIFVPTGDEAERVTRELIRQLRIYDLNLNEAKSKLMPAGLLLTEEPDLEELFQKAVEEVTPQLGADDSGVDYGFQSAWDDFEGESEDGDDEVGQPEKTNSSASPELELEATIELFDAIDGYPDQEENIERFCLPLFSKAGSDHAVEHVMKAFSQRPSMTQIYAFYLANFLDEEVIVEFLVDRLADPALVDWQKIWIAAALLTLDVADEQVVKPAWALFQDANRHEALRANAAIIVGRYGDLARRKGLVDAYAVCPPFVQAAIYYSSRKWPNVEKGNAKSAWSKHGVLNTLLTVAMEKNAA
jgi:hypothetical protein